MQLSRLTKRQIAIFSAAWAAVAAICGYLGKTAVDNIVHAVELKDEKRLALEEERLRDFWWPVYLRLELDDAAWSPIVGGQRSRDLAPFRQELVDKFLLPNHDEIVKILETKFYLGKHDMSPELETWFLQYIGHVMTYHAIRDIAARDAAWADKTPYSVQTFWPGTAPDERTHCPPMQDDCFVDAVKETVTRLQKDYDQDMDTLFPSIGSRSTVATGVVLQNGLRSPSALGVSNVPSDQVYCGCGK